MGLRIADPWSLHLPGRPAAPCISMTSPHSAIRLRVTNFPVSLLVARREILNPLALYRIVRQQINSFQNASRNLPRKQNCKVPVAMKILLVSLR